MIRRTFRPAGAVSSAADPGRTHTGGGMPSPVAAAKSWSPTVANLLVLIVVEIAAFAAIRYAFKRIS